MSDPAFQERYSRDFQHCYGCGALNAAGLGIRSFARGADTVARFTPGPAHTALPGYVYGGLIASLIDCHGVASAAAYFASPDTFPMAGASPLPRLVTASLHVDFLRPTALGPEIELTGRLEEKTPRKTIVLVDVRVHGVLTAKGRVVAVPAPAAMMDPVDLRD